MLIIWVFVGLVQWMVRVRMIGSLWLWVYLSRWVVSVAVNGLDGVWRDVILTRRVELRTLCYGVMSVLVRLG